MKHDFTYDSYRALLQSFLDRGYRVRDFEEADPAERHLIVRHDIDMSLALAEPIAEIEADLGISAIYFVLVGSKLYNPLSKDSRISLNKIRSCGHKIGLHFDASCYGDVLESLDTAADEECRVLELVMGEPIRLISFHRPVSELQGLARTLAGRRHAYEPRFFSEMGYCSDSKGGWHYGHPLEQKSILEGRAMQLLTHPIWWTQELMNGPLAKLEQFLSERRRLLESTLAENCEPYKAVFESRGDR